MGKKLGLPSVEEQEYDSELQAALKINITVDLVAAAKRQLSFLRAVHCVPGLHRGPAVIVAIKRYYNNWLPLAAEQASKSESENQHDALLPPFDVQWVWHCHRLHPMEYRKFCTSMYKKVIDFPDFTNAESEAASRDRCQKIWSQRYPMEPFDILPQVRKLATGQVYRIDEQIQDEDPDDLVSAIGRQSSFYFQVSQPYMWEDRFLRAALQRYKCFLHILRKSEGKILCVPTYDIDLMWHAHQLSPIAYADDTQALLGCVMDHDDSMVKGPNTKLGQGFQDTAGLWENTFGHPYEKAGAMYQGTLPLCPTPLPSDEGGFERVPVALPWAYQPRDMNAGLKVLSPRSVVEVCILVRTPILPPESDIVIRMRALGAHRLMKLETPLVSHNEQPQWQKLWLFQCEKATRGVILELRSESQSCFNRLSNRKLLGKTVLQWQELQESRSLSIDRSFALEERRHPLKKRRMPSPGALLRLAASITPPVSAPYLLKSVPDRVTDDSGAMISRAMLRMNNNRPQAGRWMSRTVLDHTGKECFVIRLRAARGIWKKGGDRPVGVDWNERVIHVCEGGWRYKSGYIGKAPDKVIGSATPFADDLGQYKLRWSFSSGEMLTISRPTIDELNWEGNLTFTLDGSSHGLVRLLNGRKLVYEVPGATAEDEEGFVTVVRHTTDAPQGKATALFNWKISAMEVYPEEDVLLVLLLCTSTLRSVTDLGGTNYENLYARRRAKETKPGLQDWGSVVLENPTTEQSNLMLWYVKPENVKLLASTEAVRTGSLSSVQKETERSDFICAVDWEGGKSFAEETSRHVGFGGGMAGRQDRRTGSGIQLDAMF